MKKKFVILAAVVALVALAAAPASAQRPAWSQKSDETIVSTVLSSGDIGDLDTDETDFDILREALVATGLVNVFDGKKNFTVFAPRDAAFYALTGTDNDADALAATIAAAPSLGGLENVLLYHVTNGVRPSPSVVNPPSVGMLNGGRLTAAELVPVALDVRVQDGMIHVIDAVLIP